MRTIRKVSRDELPEVTRALLADGFQAALVACHDDGDRLRIVYSWLATAPERRTDVEVTVAHDDAWVPSLADLDFAVGRFEREVRDLYGVRPDAHPLPQRLVRHAHWPQGWYPMLQDADPMPAFGPDTGSIPFGEVGGTGVYEIPVGPVHAGMIEPGHFRFSVVGETILKMKARLWFVHRGVEKLFEGRRPADAFELSERISGDTAVGHSLAFALAVEEASGTVVSEQDQRLRALLLELERLYNHVGDLGAIANDVGFGIAHAHAQRLRETLLRVNESVTGHRLLRGAITVGGTRVQSLPDLTALDRVVDEVAELVDIVLGQSVVRDRLTGTAVLPYAEATALHTVGFVARASGVDSDARRDHPFVELGDALTVVTEPAGDVLARFRLRAREIEASAALVRSLAAGAGDGAGDWGSGRRHEPDGPGTGLGVVEAWRGRLVHRVELGPDGRLTRVKVVDPSFFNWPALPVALADTIVPDFPLANKSFNQSYAGNDL
jgi:Ni,Fe-hydrogenase III large subunit/Ni,Fe-hydrogenase III component G